MGALKFANINFKGLSKEELLRDDKHLKIVVTANSEIIIKGNNDKKLQQIMNENYTSFDGRVPQVLAEITHKKKIEKISGSDFIYDCCRHAKATGKRVFLLGCSEEVNKKAVKNIRESYGIQCEGFSPVQADYPFPELHNKQILNRIKLFRPHFLFVGFGAPKQEYWINDNKAFLEELGVTIAVGSGGTFDFVSGKVKRAPRFIQKIGLEGIWRFAMEPKWFRIKRVFLSFKIFYYWLAK